MIAAGLHGDARIGYISVVRARRHPEIVLVYPASPALPDFATGVQIIIHELCLLFIISTLQPFRFGAS